jgi:hypothetical protein
VDRCCTVGWEGTPVLGVVGEDGTAESGSGTDGLVREGREADAARLCGSARPTRTSPSSPGRRGRGRLPSGGACRPPPAPQRGHCGRAGRGHRVPRQRQVHRRGRRAADVVLLEDPATPGGGSPPKDQSGACPALPVRTHPPASSCPPERFLGSSAGLPPATVSRLTKQWSDGHAAFRRRDLSGSDYVLVWADGVRPEVRLGQAHSGCWC